MPKPIRELIPGVMKQVGGKAEAAQRLQHEWARLVGKAFAAHTKPMSLRGGRLIVHVDDPGTSYSLTLEKVQLAKRLAKATDRQVDEIVIRAGEV